MPLIVAIAIRYIIMAAVQLGLWSLIEKYGLPLINKAIQELIEVFGVSEEDAQDIMANKILIAFEQVGIFALTLRTKMPVKVAERLGFTSKGWGKRTIKSTKGKQVDGLSINATSKVKATPEEIKSLGNTVSLNRGIKTLTIITLVSAIMGVVSATSTFMMAISNVIDFGNWQGAYQKTFQKIFTALGFPPDSPMPKARTLSAETWQRIYATVEVLNPVGISFPFSGLDKPYSRDNLADMIDEIAANLVKDGQQATYKNVIGIALPLIQLKGQPDISKLDNITFTKAVASAGAQPKTTTPTQQVKVFTGVISQGALGQGLTFQERQDDLIENMDELKQASSNNLAPFLAALPSRVRYEIKVVSSITTKDGFTQKGNAQQIKVGTYQDGKPKYKTVVNKFAVMDLYIFTDRNTKTKITTIVLGPTNAVTFQPGLNDLNSLAQELPKLITTQNVNEVSNITNVINNTENNNNIASSPTYQKPEDELNDTGFRFYKFSVNGETYFELLPWAGNIPFGYTMITKQEYLDQETLLSHSNPTRWKGYFEQIRAKNPTAFTTGKSGYVIKDGVPYYVGNGSVNDTINSVTSASNNGNKSGLNALTLSEWYQSQGQALPSVSERSVIYERLGLGPSSFYTGTSEQNTKLLNALKYK